MIVQLLIIFLFAIVFSFIDFVNKKNERTVLFLFLTTMILMAGFREVGVDQDSVGYVKYYNSKNISLLAEPTFVYITYFVKYFFGNVQALFFIYALVGISLKFYAFTRLSNLWLLTLLVYISRTYLFYDLNVIRAGVSCGLLLLSIPYIAERKIWHFLALALLATLFHYSALLVFPLWFLTNKKMSNRYRTFLMLLIPFSYILYLIGVDLIASIPIPMVEQKLQVYAAVERMGKQNMSNVNVFNLFQLLRCAIFFYLLYFYDLLVEKNKYFTILLKIFALSLIALPLLSKISLLALRVGALFGIVELILIPLIYYTIKPKIFGKVVILVISLLYFWYNISVAEMVYW